jgi:thioredoxin 1
MSIKSVTDHDLAVHVAPQGVTLVDFGAPWCPPCKALLPILDQLDEELGTEEITILKVNADESPISAGVYGVMSMPTVILFKDGEPVDKLVGLRPKEAYMNVIRRHMGA